jgi:hypothetical protein
MWSLTWVVGAAGGAPAGGVVAGGVVAGAVAAGGVDGELAAGVTGAEGGAATEGATATGRGGAGGAGGAGAEDALEDEGAEPAGEASGRLGPRRTPASRGHAMPTTKPTAAMIPIVFHDGRSCAALGTCTTGGSSALRESIRAFDYHSLRSEVHDEL